MRYEATARQTPSGDWYPCVHDGDEVAPGPEPRALRQARAMKAVLLAVRAWKRDAARYAAAEQKGVLYCDGGAVIFRRADAERRLYAAQERLERIEKEVSRG